jgi:hypothetical protein
LQQSDQLETIGENPPLATDLMVRQSMPEVKQQHWPVATAAWLTMMRIGELLRTAR